MTGDIGDPERALALSYAPPHSRDALGALFALDDALAQLLRTTREPALGQMRLAWWREALARLDEEPAPAEPVLQAIAREVLPKGLRGAALVPIVHGWEVLIEEEMLDHDALERFAEGRGQVFVAAGTLVGTTPGDPLVAAGRGWALADLSRHLQGPDEAERARALATPLLDVAAAARWSRKGRALGALAHLARLDLRLPKGEQPRIGAPHRVGRLLWHRLTGS
ncbi:squalene/phytoene synthase family protein [Sphingomonas psychrotolerans]|uniref:Squalene/phytoene synthase family protein n=1 Tax=Sphingomonas psychrotolerans TaxID=1327635 RepID=A0ABU3N0P2_9SPHN|nr:squalene/phytoene synthase family protein [Sphingomonas psychrotolerans]MDT8758043.1 squalene/phytoene synthase family protein [Sphingomonas psychrotolerans]